MTYALQMIDGKEQLLFLQAQQNLEQCLTL
jgi:hypothetical protein